MTPINIAKAPKNSAVLPFYGTAAFCFLLLTVLLWFSADDLLQFYFNPHILAIVHIAALGWGTMIIFGAAYQLLPVICERDLYSSALSFVSYCLLTVGILLLAIAFWWFRTGMLMITAGGLIFCSAVVYFINVWQTAKICVHYSIQKMFVFSSAAWLLVTISIGLLLAVNLKYPFISGNHLDILKLHAHAGLAGWFLQLITGISVKLVPMFLLGKSDNTRLLKWSFILQNTGLILFLADGYLFGVSVSSLFYAIIVAVGILCWLAYLREVFRHRIKKAIDLPMRHTLLSFTNLITALLLIPAICLSTGYKWAIVYGVLLFFGWVSAIALGMTFKTLPFIVWNDHYKKLNGKVKVPLPKQLYSEKLLKLQFLFFISSLYLLALGIIIQEKIIIRLALSLWVITALIYISNVCTILLHKTKVIDGNTTH